MGGSQSTRQIVIDNENNIVKVTEDVQRRLLGIKETERKPSAGGQQQQLSDEQVESMRKQIESEYRQRVTEASTHSHKIKAEEFARAVQEVEQKFIKETGSPVAQDLQQKVYECYQENLHKPLNCSMQVREFVNTVEKARQNAVFTRKS